MLKFNDKGMPIYTDPASELMDNLKFSILDTERKEMETKRQDAEARIQAELKQAEADIRDRYRAELGTGVMGESPYMSALRDFTKQVCGS